MSNKIGRLLKVILSLTLVSLMIMACNVQTKEIDLVFQSIEQRQWGGPLNEASGPSLVIISRLEEVKDLDGLITDEALQALLTLDYNNYFALAAFQGLKGSAGYKIQIVHLIRLGKNVNISVQLQEPGPKEPKADIMTSPYDLIIVEKNGKWETEITFNMIAGDVLVSSVSHIIP